ncbi:MAG: class SAM-dependent methyltransferase [Acidimicrobiales bacterium]|nr:class SAM-dependent methyltransferase [Acidimicrobiales bacterium]
MAADVGDDQMHWVDETEFTIGDTTFVANPTDRFIPTPDRFSVVKPPGLVRQYAELIRELQPKRIVELGIFSGGSTALLNELAQPTKLVSADVKEERVPALDAYLAAHGAQDRVKAHYSVNQGDQAQLRALLDAEFGADELDLVVDDASHATPLTRASFDVLFPRLRPGGVFIIEDWAWAHLPSTYRNDEVPLTVVVFEAIMTCASRAGFIDEVVVDPHWALIRRGNRVIDRDTFALGRCYSNRSRALVNGLQGPTAVPGAPAAPSATPAP